MSGVRRRGEVPGRWRTVPAGTGTTADGAATGRADVRAATVGGGDREAAAGVDQIGVSVAAAVAGRWGRRLGLDGAGRGDVSALGSADRAARSGVGRRACGLRLGRGPALEPA